MTYNAELVTIKSIEDEKVLLKELLIAETYNEPIWIGLSKRLFQSLCQSFF